MAAPPPAAAAGCAVRAASPDRGGGGEGGGGAGGPRPGGAAPAGARKNVAWRVRGGQATGGAVPCPSPGGHGAPRPGGIGPAAPHRWFSMARGGARASRGPRSRGWSRGKTPSARRRGGGKASATVPRFQIGRWDRGVTVRGAATGGRFACSRARRGVDGGVGTCGRVESIWPRPRGRGPQTRRAAAAPGFHAAEALRQPPRRGFCAARPRPGPPGSSHKPAQAPAGARGPGAVRRRRAAEVVGGGQLRAPGDTPGGRSCERRGGPGAAPGRAARAPGDHTHGGAQPRRPRVQGAGRAAAPGRAVTKQGRPAWPAGDLSGPPRADTGRRRPRRVAGRCRARRSMMGAGCAGRPGSGRGRRAARPGGAGADLPPRPPLPPRI
jgi:translation initiation factor IF-2